MSLCKNCKNLLKDYKNDFICPFWRNPSFDCEFVFDCTFYQPIVSTKNEEPKQIGVEYRLKKELPFSKTGSIVRIKCIEANQKVRGAFYVAVECQSSYGDREEWYVELIPVDTFSDWVEEKK